MLLVVRSIIARLARQERGVILVETLLAVPVLTLLTFTILEFGNMMWQREQLQAGVKDAARYWARCRPVTATGDSFMNCDIATARRIAFSGYPTTGSGARVPGWDGDESSEFQIDPPVPPVSPSSVSLVNLSATVTYQGSALFSRLVSDSIQLGYSYQTRYLGW